MRQSCQLLWLLTIHGFNARSELACSMDGFNMLILLNMSSLFIASTLQVLSLMLFISISSNLIEPVSHLTRTDSYFHLCWESVCSSFGTPINLTATAGNFIKKCSCHNSFFRSH